MNTNELIAMLEIGVKSTSLNQTVLSALSVIRESTDLSINFDERNSVNKNSLLATHRRRQKHLFEKQIVLPGLDESIESLSKCESERISLISVKSADKLIIIWLTPSKAVVGCIIGKDHRDAEE